MPLKWIPGQNPYVHTYFGRLGLGPNASPAQVQRRKDELKKKLENRRPVELAGVALDEHALSECASKLQDKEKLAQELLLVHPQNHRESSSLKKLIADLQQAVAHAPELGPPFTLKDPRALLWFLPSPSPDIIDRPAWSDLGLVQAGDDEDLALDVVFDG